MKGLLVGALIVAMVSPAPAAAVLSRQQSQSQSLLARVTVYWASGGRGSDRYTRKHKCATGLRLRDGHCAVDPKRIPYGSHIILPDGTRLAAVDTGTAVRNRKAARLLGKTPTEKNAVVIDRFFETKKQALAWANSHPHFIPVHVVTPSLTAAVTEPAQPPLRAIAVKSTNVRVADIAGSRGALQLPKVR
jgi:3D (Asp-Asp-Asp) domain-containing protein